MAWINFADHETLSFTLDDTAVFTTLFDGRIYFHI